MINKIKFGKDGLLPCIVQDDATNEIVMFAYMNKESLMLTLESDEMWYFSRSRQELWHKGATSNNIQEVVSLYLDCDMDTLLARVKLTGDMVACHTGKYSCFFNKLK